MNVLENLLVTLMEECSEVAKAASKILRAGPDSTVPGRSTTNLQELQAELDDLQGVLMELRANGLDVVVRNPTAVTKKREKLRHYIGVSRQLGFVQGPLAAGEPLVGAPYGASGTREELIYRLINAGNFSLDYLKGLTDFELVSLGKSVRLGPGKWLELAKNACQKCGSVVPGEHMAHCEEARQ